MSAAEEPAAPLEAGTSSGAGQAQPHYARGYLLALAAALIVYGVTVAPGLLWQDNGLAQVRVLRHDLRGDLGLALSHPLYYLLGFAFQWLPFGESAFKTNLVSAVCGAVTVANVCLLLRLLTGRWLAAALGATSLAVAHTFWQHAALAEVYSVSTALLVAELLCLTRYAQTGAKYWLPLLFLANGLGVSNHLLNALHLPVWGVLLLWLLWRRRIGLGTLVTAGGAWLVGASIYLGLIASELAAGQAAGEVLRSALFGRSYTRYVLNMHVDARLLLRSLLYLGLNFPTPVVLLAFVGLAVLRRLVWRPVAGALAGMLTIHLLWAVRYNVADQYTFFIPSIVLIAILIGLGADQFLRSRLPRSTQRWARVLVVLTLLPVAVYAALPTLVRAAGVSLGVGRELAFRDSYSFFLWPWKTGYDGARRFAQEAEQVLPDGAVLIAEDTSARPIHYQMLTGRWHKRAEIWPPAPGMPDEDKLWPTEDQLEAPLRAGLVYVVTPQRRYCPEFLLTKYSFERAGLLYHVMSGAPATKRD